MKLEIRKAVKENCRDIYNWRTDERNSQFSWTGDSLTYSQHEEWFLEYLEERNYLMLIASFNDKPCSVIRFDGDIDDRTVSIYMVPAFHSHGLGMQCLLLGERYLKEEIKGLPCNLNAEIMNDNMASVKLFTRAGYIYSMADWYKVI